MLVGAFGLVLLWATWLPMPSIPAGRVLMAVRCAEVVAGCKLLAAGLRELPKYHFCHILLVKVRHKTQQEVK